MDSHVECFEATGRVPKFFKIILRNTVPEGKLRIPTRFAMQYGNCLSSPVTLQVPTGETWQVELLKIEDKIWLQRGFKEFAEYHSLKCGHLLVFKYKGDCNFSVLIFDMSAVEINYPGTGVSSMYQNHGTDLQQQMIQENEDQDDISWEDLYCSEGNEDQEDSYYEILDDSTSNGNQSSDDSHVSLEQSQEEATDALGVANILSNYPSFKVVFKHKHFVNIPFKFVQSHIGCESQTMKLQVGDKSWSVKLNVYPGNSTSIFNGGWPAFSMANSLEVGDVCIFELIKRQEIIVSISKCAS